MSEVAYAAVAAEEGFAAARVVGGPDEMEGGAVVDDTSLDTGRFVATPEGFAVKALQADDEDVTLAAIAAAEEETKDQKAAPKA